MHKWICRERNITLATDVIKLTQQANIILLTESIALLASELSQKHKLSFADAIIYATAQQQKVELITSDEHFENLPDVRYFSKKIT